MSETEGLLNKHVRDHNCLFQSVEICSFVNEDWMHCVCHLPGHCLRCEGRDDRECLECDSINNTEWPDIPTNEQNEMIETVYER